MKRIFNIIGIILFASFLITGVAFAVTILPGTQGGTNTSSTSSGNIGNCLKVDSVSPLVWTIGSCGSGSGGGNPFDWLGLGKILTVSSTYDMVQIFGRASSTDFITPSATIGTLYDTGLSVNAVPYIGAGGLFTNNATNLIWDNTDKKLVIGATGATEATAGFEVNKLGTSRTRGIRIHDTNSNSNTSMVTLAFSHAANGAILMEMGGYPGGPAAGDDPTFIFYALNSSAGLTERMRFVSDDSILFSQAVQVNGNLNVFGLASSTQLRTASATIPTLNGNVTVAGELTNNGLRSTSSTFSSISGVVTFLTQLISNNFRSTSATISQINGGVTIDNSGSLNVFGIASSTELRTPSSTIGSKLTVDSGGSLYIVGTGGTAQLVMDPGASTLDVKSVDMAIGNNSGYRWYAGGTFDAAIERIGAGSLKITNGAGVFATLTTAGLNTFGTVSSTNIRTGLIQFNTSSTASTTEGLVWADTTQKGLSGFFDGVQQQLNTTIFTATANKNVVNTVTETSMIPTGVGTSTLPATFFVPGKTVCITGGGLYGLPVAGGSATVRLKYATTSLAQVTTTGLLGNQQGERFEFNVCVTDRTTGTTGTVAVDGKVGYSTNSVTHAYAFDPISVTSTAVIDTTRAALLDVLLTWSAADTAQSATTTIVIYEVKN